MNIEFRNNDKMEKVKITTIAEVPMQSIINDVRNSMRQILHDSLNNIIDGKVKWEDMALEYLAKRLSNLSNIPDTQEKKLSHYEIIAEFWADHCSDAFFNSHPSVSDVIMVVDEDKSGEALEKFWVCRNAYITNF